MTLLRQDFLHIILLIYYFVIKITLRHFHSNPIEVSIRIINFEAGESVVQIITIILIETLLSFFGWVI